MPLVAALIIAGQTACARPVIGYYNRTNTPNIEFARRDNRPILLNVARPVGVGGKRPLVFWIHGGGWAGGSRAGLQAITNTCAEFGYVSATTDYRLTTGAYRFPVQLQDVAAALEFLIEHADDYAIDTSRIIVGGDSAGGHLALLLGMCRDADLLGVDAEAWKNVHIAGVVNIYGPTDMPAMEEAKRLDVVTRPLVDALMGQSPDKAPALWKSASPISYVSADGPPILTIHGDLDPVVPFAQAEALDARCGTVGQPHRLIRVPGASHGWIMLSKGNTVKAVMPAIMHFIAECAAAPAHGAS
ncbi:MAG TPA: alpha/beta hydrolase [Phycisphaerae bacterium]|nr:alpha/beta hydrolase [Phycisphaerae bacterium]HRW55768.1 alpha/beta hydrolase [Phycisphaerae bacterium]